MCHQLAQPLVRHHLVHERLCAAAIRAPPESQDAHAERLGKRGCRSPDLTIADDAHGPAVKLLHVVRLPATRSLVAL
jgi:hypothetical protein